MTQVIILLGKSMGKLCDSSVSLKIIRNKEHRANKCCQWTGRAFLPIHNRQPQENQGQAGRGWFPDPMQLQKMLPVPIQALTPWAQRKSTKLFTCCHLSLHSCLPTDHMWGWTKLSAQMMRDNPVLRVPFPPAPKISFTNLTCLHGQYSPVLT